MTIAMQSCSQERVGAIPRFQEPWPARIRRYALGTAYALRLSRIGLMPRLTWATVMHALQKTESLPQAAEFHGDRGFIGICNDLGVHTLLEGYRRGYFPVCHIGPMKWWCPAERAVLFPENTRIETGVRRLLRGDKFRFSFDRDFAGVMRACAEPRPGKTPLTWITPRVMGAFWDLHDAGHAHSIEVWEGDRLAGGIYGLAIGDVFFIESQFSRVSNTSKMASVVLLSHLTHWGFALVDGKWMTPHLGHLGFKAMDRTSFRARLLQHARKPDRLGRWEFEPTLAAAKFNSAPRNA
jgi:leucyl/phenylalanyl-tRNA---protein transferase